METSMNSWAYLILMTLTVSCVSEQSPENTSAGAGNDLESGSNNNNSALTDPLYVHAWHLKNTGQSSFSLTTGVTGRDINVEDVHGLMNIKGRGIKVAVSDDAVDFLHPDLSLNSLSTQHRDYSKALPGQWFGGNPSPTNSSDSHGTSVTGLIAAVGWNGIGSRGVAPEAKFAGFRYLYAFDPTESDESLLDKELHQTDGEFDIFNYSYGPRDFLFFPEEEIVTDAIEAGARFLRGGKGAIYVQSSGNGRKINEICIDPSDPGTCALYEAAANTNSHETTATPFKIIVGALNANGTVASYSTPGSGVWVTAPGGQDGFSEPAMVTTDIRGCLNGYSFKPGVVTNFFDFGYHPLNLRCDYTNSFGGTSAAAPVVSGVIALMLEQKNELTWRDVKHILAKTAVPVNYDPILEDIIDHPHLLDLPNYTYDVLWTTNKAASPLPNPYSNFYGFGTVDAEAAVAMAKTYNLSTLGTFEQTIGPAQLWYYDSGPLSLNIPDFSDLQSEDGVTNSIWVGHNLIIEAVEIELSSDHLWPGELAVHLISPRGTESRLMHLNSNIISFDSFNNTRMISNAFYEEESFGYWTIKVVDGAGEEIGDLTNWKIKVSGHKKPSEILIPHPPTNIQMPSFVSPTQDFTPEFSFNASTSPVTGYEISVGFSEFDQDVKEWTPYTITSGIVLSDLDFPLVDGVEYFLKIRARNGTRRSYPQIYKWTADL